MTTPLSTPSIPINKIQRFEDFYRLFQEKPGEFKYLDKINEIFSKGENTLVFYYEDLLSFDSDMADMLRNDPEELINDTVEAFKNVLKFQSGSVRKQDYFVRISTKDDKGPLAVPIRGLRAKHIDKLVWFNGITIRSSTVRPKLMKAEFECNLCGASFEIIQLSSKINWPRFCTNKRCKAKAQSDFRLITKNSNFIDWQSIVIQEVPEELPPGRIPRSVQAILTYDDLVDSVKPGDRVKVMGIFKSVIAQNINNNNSTLFKSFIEVNYIDPEDKSEDDIELSKEDRDQIEKLSKEPLIQKKIARSIAPTIYGRDDLKMACALSLFAGTRKRKPGGGYKRGDIHVLFVGDPGTGKSEVLKSAVEKSPRGLYTSGKGSTAVGLTAAVIKDSETAQMNLEAGAVVLANGGVAAIDEFDKMDSADRSALHEAMEQQSYHYNTEILSPNGERILIGEFVDKLLEKNKSKIINGNNCEILKYNNLELYSTDFKSIFKIKIDRISRHKAPEHFYKFTFTNGRSIIVTPEHPLFIFRDGKLNGINAEDCNTNDFIPVPKFLPNSTMKVELNSLNNAPHPLAKELSFPKYLNISLSRVIGYLVSEGHSHKGTGAEIGFSNMDNQLINDFQYLMEDIFQISPNVNERGDGLKTLRYISIELYKWMEKNFPEVMVLSKIKRIPKKILGSSSIICRECLRSAFKGDGSVESTAICFRTSSKGLSFDYQDLLLKVGIQSRIIFDKYNDSYKVYIKGESLIHFYNEIIENNDKRISKIRILIKPEKIKKHHHDILPTSLIEMLIKVKKDLAISYDGYFDRHLKKKHGVTRNIYIKELNMLRNKYDLVIELLNGQLDCKEFRKRTGYSQSHLAKISNLSRGTIDYLERDGYNREKQHKINSKILKSLKVYCKKIKTKIDILESYLNSEILWDRIKTIKIINNKGKNYTPWVYDLTVEPNHTFIAQGVILHNTVSIAKAGIVATLKSQTAIIAAANPHSGRFNEYKSFAENARMPPSLLSRFDLIFKVVDKPNPAKDAQMAEFILRNATMGTDELFEDFKDKDEKIAPINEELLKKYIKYARKTCFPVLSNKAKERIKSFYLELRGQYDSEDAIVSILARNLDALVRLSEAYAKMALRKKVNKDDVEEIIKLFKRYLKDTGYDKETGKFDVDMILVGQSRTALNKLEKLLDLLKQVSEENEWQALDKSSLVQRLELEGYDRTFIDKSFDELIKEGTLYEPKQGKIKFTRKEE
ncbi:MAG: LAGLIDADG family homing endonuclease [Promethearchaeota archaeon]